LKGFNCQKFIIGFSKGPFIMIDVTALHRAGVNGFVTKA
jgi:hypothetical protein